MTNWIYIKKECYLYQIFGDRPVKVDSLIPATPREEGAPPCYWVLSSDLSEPEILQLSILLYQRWRPECKSLADAEQYIREKNVPLAVSNTSRCMTDEGANFPLTAAINLTVRGMEIQDDEADLWNTPLDSN